MLNVIYKVEDGELVKGTVFRILLHHFNDYQLVDLTVYADGIMDCFGPLTFDTLCELLKTQKLVCNPPAEQQIFIPHIGNVRSSQQTSPMTDKRFLEIVVNAIQELRNGPSPGAICIQLYKEYLLDDSDENFHRLTSAYQNLTFKSTALVDYVDHEDPLVLLMNGGPRPTREQRENILHDYFYGQWVALK